MFTATVTNATSTSVTWSVNGVTGGNIAVGTIDTNGLYRAPSILPSPASVTIQATSVASPTSSGTATVTVTSVGASISKVSPASITSLTAGSTDFLLKVEGLNFVAGAPGSGATIVFNAQNLSTTCSSTVCTATISAASVTSPGDYGLRVVNPATSSLPGPSNLVGLKVLDATTESKDINDATVPVVTLTTANPNQGCTDPPLPTDPGCQNISVVEPTTAGSLVEHYNMDLIGIVAGGACNLRGTGITLTRPAPAAGVQDFDICVQNNTTEPSLVLKATDTYTISGPNPNDITIVSVTDFGGGLGTIQIKLQIGSTTVVGPRTLFVENKNREKAALVGGIEVK